MSDGIDFFDTEFDPQVVKKFHFEIMKVDSGNVSFLSNFFMNNKNDYVFRDTNMNVYLFVQYGKNISSPADYIENSRNTSTQSNVLEQIHSKIDGIIHKKADDGIVTLIDSVESMMNLQNQSQVVNIHNNSGCDDCTSKDQLIEKDAEIKTLNRVIEKIGSQVNGIAVEVGAVESSMQTLFDEFPNHIVRRAFASCIVSSENANDIDEGLEYAKLFENSAEPIMDMSCDKLLAEAHNIIDDYYKFFTLATHPDSEDGDMISKYEDSRLDTIVSAMIKVQLSFRRLHKQKIGS